MSKQLSPELPILPPENGETYTDEDFERSIEEGELTRAQVRHLLHPYLTVDMAEPAPSMEPVAGPGRTGSARRGVEPRFSRRSRPRSWRDRMAADQAPPHMRRPQPGEN